MAPRATPSPQNGFNVGLNHKKKASDGSDGHCGVVDDWTDWPRFGQKLLQYTLATYDAILWSIISVITIVFMSIAGIASFWFIEPVVRLISPLLSTPFKTHKGSFPPSLVSSGTPDFFPEYTRYLASSNVWESLGPTLSDSKSPNPPSWDVDVARFMLHLSALTYEHPDVVSFFASQWNLECTRVLKRNFASYMYYSTKYPFVVVAFKGTSPFDLSEWLTDVMMVKVRPDGSVLPGQVHESFYNSFSWDTPGQTQWSNNHECDIDKMIDKLNSTVIPGVTSNPNKKINLWITGHSLGAALATIFLSHLTYPSTSAVDPNAKLRGAYTFGSPRVGDFAFASITESQTALAKASCFRVVNANDMIPALPLTSALTIFPVYQVLKDARGKAPNMVTDFEHVGTPVTLGYDHVTNVDLDRTWVSIAKNSMGYMLDWPRYFWDLTCGRETFGGFSTRCLQAFPYDHTPSEYDRHLRCKAK
jgi:hypothetical protein